MYDILVIGEINVDLIAQADDVTPVFGQEKLVDDLTLTMGSSSVIFAAQAARLGLHVGFCGLAGDDDFGRFMLREMSAVGVDTTPVIVDPSFKTGVTISLSTPTDRALITHMGAINQLRAEQIAPEWLSQARHVHVGAFFLQDALRPGLPELLGEAQTASATTSLDCGWDPRERWNGDLQAALPHATLFLPNEVEAAAITGRKAPEEALAALAESVPIAVVKLGKDGAIARRGGESVAVPAFPVRVVDTTGAGDSFDAGFVFAYLQGWDLRACLLWGAACGALSTRAAGGTGSQGSREDVERVLAEGCA
jgi:sugar/nucleoside kinase (ribokinase family)